MVCIYCTGKTKVTNSRAAKRAASTWRRRECLVCHALFTSREHADLSQTHMVRHTDASLEPFSRDNLFVSIHESCKHRRTALEDATALTDTIIMSLVRKSKDGMITTADIVAHARDTLIAFDTVAGTYYKAYYD